MTLLNIKYKRLFISALTIALVSCSSPWDDREDNGDPNLNNNLYEMIADTKEGSEFTALLVKTGYDEILEASKSYTVFVPTNEALKSVSASVLNDPEALKKFVANHIALTSFSSVRKTDEEKVKMLSDKYLIFKGSTTIDDATIITADHYASNGVFHMINKALTPKLNIWEYVNSKAGSSAMCDYLLSLKDLSIYESDIEAKAKEATGVLADSLSNSYLKNVYNLSNEKNSYTLFLMEDDGYNSEVDKMKPYLNKSTADLTATYSSYFTVRDLAFPKAYKKEVLPEKLTSRFGVQFDVDKTQIVGEPIQLSNGVIYIMKKVDVKLSDRLLTTKIEGEKNDTYFNGARNKIFYRDKRDMIEPFGVFQDVVVVNPGVPYFMLSYSAKDLYSNVKYKVYWRAINDLTATNIVFTQALAIYGKSKIVDNVTYGDEKIADFGYKNVEANFYQEVYIGEFTLNEARNLDFITLTSINSNSTTSGLNSLSLDYLKFVPEVK